MPPENFPTENPPYWNFWKVVFAGWLIRYPGKFFKAIMWIVIALTVGVMYVIDVGESEGIDIDNTEQIEYNDRDRMYDYE